MKLLYVTPSYPPMVGGGELLVQALAKEAAAVGHKVTVVTSDVAQSVDFWRWRPGRGADAPQEAHDGPVRVIRCPAAGIPAGWPGLLAWRKAMIVLSAAPGNHERLLMRMARRVPTIMGLERVLADLEPHDLVQGFNMSWEYALLAGWRHARARGIPFVVRPDMHLGTPDDPRVARNNTMAHQLRVLRDAEAVVVNTSIERDGLIALGISPERIHVVGSGLHPQHALTEAEAVSQAMQTYGLTDPLVLFIGRVCRDKGALDAAEAVLALAGRGAPPGPPCLALAGAIAPDFARYYRRLAPSARKQVRPLGLVSETDKHALLSRAQMLVLPSRVDSFGIVLLEAWAHGKPVIGARAGGIPAVVDEGVDGLLVPWGDVRSLADAMARILDDPEAAARMGAAGREKLAREYTWGAVYARLDAVYQRLLRSR